MNNLNQKSFKITYQEIADFFLAFGNETGEMITNLKLQKLVYYAQAWHLANFNAPLFEDDFQAWVHGPVLPALYQNCKTRGSNPILSDKKIKHFSGIFSEDTFSFLREIAKVYMPFSAYQLELMTHREDPWIEARKGLDPDERCSEIIKKESMRRYYGEKIQNQS